MKTGRNNNYIWAVSDDPILYLHDTIVEYHEGKILYITSFDSGPLRLTEEEQDRGWIQYGDIAINPLIKKGIQIPHDDYDEWYISDVELKFPDEFEAFVNYGAFRLQDPAELTKDDDPSWERGRFDFLYPLQEKFWALIESVQPQSYIAIGGREILVSTNEEFIEALMKR